MSLNNFVTFFIIGDAYVDYFCFLDDGGWPEFGGDSRLVRPIKYYAGGSSTNTATHLKFLTQHFMLERKSEVNLHTVLNPNDQYGRLLLQHAQDHDLAIVNCWKENDNLSTGHCIVVISDDDRSFMTHQGVVGQFGADDLNMETFVSTPNDIHIHIAGFYNIPGFWNGKLKEKLEFLRSQRAKLFPTKNTTISLVTQHDATKEWDGGLHDIIPLVDFVVMNRLEAKNIVKRGNDGFESTLRSISDDEIEYWAIFFGAICSKTNIVVTKGKEGAVVLRNGQVIASQEAIPVAPVDPTGAGDAFTAGFIHGLWSWKMHSALSGDAFWPIDAIQEGLRWGCACGTAVVEIQGASVPPAPKDIKKYRQEAKK